MCYAGGRILLAVGNCESDPVMQFIFSLDFIECSIALVLGLASVICFYKYAKSAKPPRPESVVMGCGSCGHPVDEAQGLICPECGENFRMVGIYPNRDEARDKRADLLMIACFFGAASLFFLLPQVLQWL